MFPNPAWPYLRLVDDDQRIIGMDEAILLTLGGDTLPLTIDFTTLPNGSLPSLYAPTWAVSGGAAVNTPSTGAELLTDPGLEATYTAGLCATLVKGGTPTLAQSADVHGGAKAQSFIGSANNDSVRFAQIVPVANRFYQATVWAKRTAGAGGGVGADLFGGGLPFDNTTRKYTNASYAQYGMVAVALTTANLFLVVAYEQSATHDTVIVDDASLKQITTADLFALLPPTQGDVIVKTRWNTWDNKGIAGVIVKADAQINPQNFLIAYFQPLGGNTQFVLDKCVGGVFTHVQNTGLVVGDPDPTKDLEVRTSGTTVRLYYGGVQKGTDYTITDAAIQAGTIHGVLASGGSQLTRFFAQPN